MNEWLIFTAGLGIGVYLGAGYRRLWAVVKYNLGRGEPEPAPRLPPLRLVKEYSVTSPARIEPVDHRDEWNRAVLDFAFWSNMCGMAEARVFAHGVASRPSIRAYRRWFAERELWVVTERGATTWVRGWNYPRLRAEITHGVLSLPYPEHKPWPLRMAWRAAQTAQRSADGAGGADKEN